MKHTIPMIHTLAAADEARGAIHGDLPIPMVSTGDIGRDAARAMLARNVQGKVVRKLHGQRDVSVHEAVQMIHAALGRAAVTYVQEEPEATRRMLLAVGLSEHVATLMLEVADALNTEYVHMLEPRSAANTGSTAYKVCVDQVLRSSS